jgi:hypothetical protein
MPFAVARVFIDRPLGRSAGTSRARSESLEAVYISAAE